MGTHLKKQRPREKVELFLLQQSREGKGRCESESAVWEDLSEGFI